MNKMIIYFSLFIPLLFLSTDSSSLRDRSNKNELVPFLSSRVDPLKRDSNSLKIVSNEPFIIQLQMPNSKEKESKRTLGKDKKRKRPLKKRVSKIKALRNKHRARRELFTPKTKIREQKSNQSEVPNTDNMTEQQITNLTKNSINRMEILKALSSYSKRIETKRNKLEEIKNVEKIKHNFNAPSRNHHNHDFSLSDRTPHVKMIYPNTPKPDHQQHKYTYKDLMADRERLEQKIKYIKNMLNVNDSADDSVRVRRRSDSDRTANKIAKMFLTLSAVNGLHDKRKSKCREDNEEEDRVQDVWEKERRNNPARKSSSSNEERYKVRKWIEYMKNKRSSGKTCPCMANEYSEESDIFPLEQKLPKDYFLKGRSSEESSESYSDPFYYSRDKLHNNNLKNRSEKSQDQENKLKALAKNGKKKLELPFDDLEVYRSRAKQILQNAEEILDRIKEEEEKRLHSPVTLMNQLKELTSRIQTDPRNNENDFIRKIQKNLGWGTLAKSNKETNDNTFIDNVKSFILDPYEKAKALTDESTKKLSSYLLRNLGKLQESSEEQEESNQETAGQNSQAYFERIPQKEEEKLVSASLAKEDPSTKIDSKEEENLKNYEDTLLVNLNDDDEINNKSHQEEIFKQKVEDMIKEQQKKINEYKVRHNSEESSQEIDGFDRREEKVAKTGIETVGESESERNLGNEEVTAKLKEKEENKNDEEKSEKLMNSEPLKQTEIEAIKSTEDATLTLRKIPENSDFVEKKKNDKTDEKFQEKKDQTGVTIEENVPAKEEFEKETEETIAASHEKDENDKLDLVVNNQEINADEKEQGTIKEVNEKNEERNHKESEKAKTSLNAQETSSGENADLKIANQKKREENILLSPHYLFYDYDNEDSETPFDANENLKDIAKMIFEENSEEAKSSKETILQKQEKTDTETNEEDSAKTILDENSSAQYNKKEFSETSGYSTENVNLKASADKTSAHDQEELLEGNEKQNLSNAETTQTGAKNVDQVQESIGKSKEILESNHSENTENSLKSSEQSYEKMEEKLEENQDQNLTTENPDDETNQASEDEREKKKTDDETKQKVSENSEELEKKLNQNRSKSAFDREDRENLNEGDINSQLRGTSEKNSNEDLNESEKVVQKSHEIFDNGNEDDKQLQAAKFEIQKSETTEKNISDEMSLKEAFENRNQHENENDETILKANKPVEEMSKESIDESKSEDVNAEVPLEKKNNEETESNETPLKTAMNEQSNEKDAEAENIDETTLREAMSKEDNEKEVNEKLKHSNEEGSSETFLKSHLKEHKDSEASLKIANPKENINESNGGETENGVKEIRDGIFPKDFQKSEDGKQSSLESEKLTDNFKSQEANEKDLGNLNETDDETTSIADIKDKKADRSNENDEKESTLSLAKSESEDWDENQNQKWPLSNQEQDKLKKEESKEITLKEASQEYQSSENSGENDGEKTLKASLNKQNQENSEVNDLHNQESNQDLKSKEESSDETLKEVLITEPQIKLNKLPGDETVKASKQNEELEQNREKVDNDETYLKSILMDNNQKSPEGTDDDKIIKESSKDFEQRQNNFNDGSDEASERKISDNQEKATKMNDDKHERKLNEDKSSQNEENLEDTDDDGSPLRMENPDEDENNKEMGRDNPNSIENEGEEISLESTAKSQNEKKEEISSNETLGAENFEEDQEREMLNSKGDGTYLKTASSEDELDNKIEGDETFVKAAKNKEKKDDKDLLKNISKDENKETLREENIPDDSNNQIDQENDDENPLRSKHFDEINEKNPGKTSHEESYEAQSAGRPSVENLSAEDNYEPQLKSATLLNHANSLSSREEQNNPPTSDLIQKTDSAKADKLKVPKSIGKIMKALEGKEKDDITSFRNLNPDKIDYIIDKIDEAEQENLRQSQEVDCRKECACAEELDTKSRNMGRYEIVKDFLFWMKDLQLNRVLSDD